MTKEHYLKFICENDNKNYDFEFHFSPFSESSTSGDPHFQQQIFDEESLSWNNICYDVTGVSGQNIHIYEFKSTNISVFGELLDDYYMHQIQLFLQSTSLKITVNEIFYENQRISSWHSLNENEQQKMILHKDIEISLTKPNSNEIVIKQKSNNFEIFIKKSINNFNILHLDVYLKMNNFGYENMGGLIGYVGNRKYKIFKSTQKRENMLTLKAENSLINGEIKTRNGKECIFVNFKQLIYPKMHKNFIY